MYKVFGRLWGVVILTSVTFSVRAETAPAIHGVTDGVISCPASFEFHPEKDGIYDLSSGVKSGTITPPRVIKFVVPEFTNEAREQSNKISDFHPMTMLSVVLDDKGKPRDMCVLQSAPYGLDKQAVKAVGKDRFEPARRGEPLLPFE